MIVHNGTFLPYLNTITENLHYYVDVLIDTLLEYYNLDFRDNNSIYRDIMTKEIQYQMTLGRKELSKNCSPKDGIDISKENVFELLFNEN